MAKKRTPVPNETLQNVLVKSRRRCCLCYGLEGNDSPVDGQIAHLDRDPGNSTEDNLVFLCLNHHNQYDSVSKRTKPFLPSEVKHYRDLLYKSAGPVKEEPSPWTSFDEFDRLVGDVLRRELESSLGVDVPINHRQRLVGRSGNPHEVDLSFEIAIAGIKLLIVVEVKHYKRKVAVNDVLSFASVIDDLGANKGIFVANAGFQEGAKRLADSRGIALVQLNSVSDTQKLEWIGSGFNVNDRHLTKP